MQRARSQSWRTVIGLVFVLGCTATDVSTGASKPTVASAAGCAVASDGMASSGPCIRLRWIHSYPGDSQSRTETGLYWALSVLGAEIRAADAGKVVAWLGPTTLRLDLGHAGFPKAAIAPLSAICAQLRATEEYKVFGAIDVGRFVMLTVNTSAHYYEIVQAKKTWAAFSGDHPAPTHHVHVTGSLVAKGDRLLRGVAATDASQIAWIAEEGIGSLAKGTFKLYEREVIDVMANGQLRFAVYGLDGELRSWASPKHGAAGKPARCMFCHESGIEPLWLDNAAGPGGMSQPTFNQLRAQQMTLLGQYRSQRPTAIQYHVTDEHSQMELIYTAFMEPTVKRLALEWGLPESTVKTKLKGLPTHYEETYRAWLTRSYNRHEVDALAPYQHLPVPGHARKHSTFEPNYLPDFPVK
ncbi:MAG: hypothetical protein KC502_20840 [Myxococcales bacterium]|nr:hypothetical protein [Myxococcales bacterium]